MAMRKPGADRTVTVVLYDGDYGFAMNVFKNLYLGPGPARAGGRVEVPGRARR